MPTPTKMRITAAPIATTVYGLAATAGRHAAPEAVVQVLDVKPGSVGWKDKAKAYYKGIIAVLGALLTVLTALTLPAPADTYTAAAVSAITAVLVVLRANETWIDQL